MVEAYSSAAVVSDRFAVEVMDDLADRLGSVVPATWDDAKAASVLDLYQEAQGLPPAARPDLPAYMADRRRWAAELDREKSRPAWAR